MKALKSILIAGVSFSGTAQAVDLSPSTWPADVRAAAEAADQRAWSPSEARTHSGKNGAVSATVSAISVAAGLEVLRHGGTAADAATAISMTGITTQMGSIVSYAGIMSLVYYDAKTKKVYSLDAGYNSYRGEHDPLTIPKSEIGGLGRNMKDLGAPESAASKDQPATKDLGRETLVGGYMAGFEAMQKRFGKLAWKDLFAPAIYYAEHGLILSPQFAKFFDMRRGQLSRTEEGRDFLRGGSKPTLAAGTRFVQPGAAKTLRAVADKGASYMYTGDWGKEFVRIVQREGGRVTAADLADYRPMWSEPLSTSFAGTTVYTPGGVSFSGYNIIPLLNAAEAMGLEKLGALWEDPKTFAKASKIVGMLEGAPIISPYIVKTLADNHIEYSKANLLTKEFAQKMAPLIDQVGVTVSGSDEPRHSNSVVVVDKWGNVAAITHTINAVIWGGTGIVVEGIPIPDSAGFQQKRLSTMQPGDRLPNEMVQAIALKNGKAVMATAGIGSSLVPENLKMLLSVLGQGRSLADAQAAPPMMTSFRTVTDLQKRPPHEISVPEGSYSTSFLAGLKADGLSIREVPMESVSRFRGTIAAVVISPETGERTTVDTPGVMLSGGAN